MRAGAPLYLGAAGVSGALVALQQQVNGDLAVSLDDAVLAAVVSFATGLALVVLVVAVRRDAWPKLQGLRSIPWHWRLGGLGGASLVAAGAAAAPRIGVALFTVGLVAGTTLGGLVVDLVGLGPGGSHPLTVPRVAGAGIGLLAIVASAAHGLQSANPWLLLAVVAAGCMVSYQQAVNGRVRAATDPVIATLQNFVVGMIALLLGLLLRAVIVGLGDPVWPGPDRAWLYLGGPIGAAFVAVAAVVVMHLGVLRFGLAVTAGQLVGAVLLDLDRGLAGTTLLGAALAMCAVAVSGLRPRRQVAP